MIETPLDRLRRRATETDEHRKLMASIREFLTKDIDRLVIAIPPEPPEHPETDVAVIVKRFWKDGDGLEYLVAVDVEHEDEIVLGIPVPVA